jgi:hypothetical protein
VVEWPDSSVKKAPDSPLGVSQKAPKGLSDHEKQYSLWTTPSTSWLGFCSDLTVKSICRAFLWHRLVWSSWMAGSLVPVV